MFLWERVLDHVFVGVWFRYMRHSIIMFLWECGLGNVFVGVWCRLVFVGVWFLDACAIASSWKVLRVFVCV